MKTDGGVELVVGEGRAAAKAVREFVAPRLHGGGGVPGGGDWAGAAGMEWYGGAREVVLVVGMGTPTTGARGDSWGGACAWGGARGPCRGGRWMRLWSSSSNRTMARVGRVPRRYLAVSTRM